MKDYEKIVPSNWGGPRPNAGRDLVLDKKQQVPIGIRASQIKLLGGREAVQEIMRKAIEEEIKKQAI